MGLIPIIIYVLLSSRFERIPPRGWILSRCPYEEDLDTSNPEDGSSRSTRLVINRRNDPLTGESGGEEVGKRLARHEGDGEAKGKPRRFDGDRENNNDSTAAR